MIIRDENGDIRAVIMEPEGVIEGVIIEDIEDIKPDIKPDMKCPNCGDERIGHRCVQPRGYIRLEDGIEDFYAADWVDRLEDCKR